MKVLVGNEITPDMLVSSSAPERLPGQVEWLDQAWPAGSVVTRTATQRVYRAAYAVPAGSSPPEQNIAAAALPFWTDRGPMNRWAMLDSQLRTQTVSDGELRIVLRPGAISSIWVGNLSYVQDIRVVVRGSPGGPVVYDETKSLYPDVVSDWYGYWFEPFKYQSDTTFSDIPAYSNCEVEITFSAGGEMRVGMALFGTVEKWGRTEWDVGADYNNYSQRSLDSAWGPTQATEGEVTKDVNYRVFVKPEDAPRVDVAAENAMKRPAIYIPSEHPNFAGIRIFGQAISIHMGYPEPRHVPLDITVREFL